MGVTNSPGFCVLPWIHMSLTPDGSATLCCQSPPPLRDDKGEPLNAQTHSLREIWHSPALTETRRRMAAGERLPECAACWGRERFAGESLRTISRARWLDDNPGLRAAIDAAPSGIADDPLYMDVRLGNLCNLKCTICKPLYSSQIERDPVHAKWNTDAPHNRIAGRFGDRDWSQSDMILTELIDISGNVASIMLAGGEPTINRPLMAWLAHFCRVGRAGEIDLVINTNLTNVRAGFLAPLSQFKSVRCIVSIDGHGPTYEYVRYPAKWDSIQQNIAKLRAARPDIDITVACVLQALNPASLIDLFDWALGEGLPVLLDIGRGLDHYNDFRILPKDYRAALRNRLMACLERHSNRAVADLRANVEQVFDEVDTMDFSEETRRENVVGFMQFVNDMDAARGLSFKSIAPEIYGAVSAYCGSWNGSYRYFAG